jgi:O-antigen/teichoic acid export membrane protein
MSRLVRVKMKKIFTTCATFFRSPLIKNLFIFSIGSLMLRGISIFLAPITMNILEPKDYGLLSLANSAISLFVCLNGIGLRQAFSVEYFHCTAAQKKLMINSMILIYLIVTLPPLACACCVPALINKFIFLNSAPYALIFLSLAYCFLYFFVEIFYQALTYRAHIVQLTALQLTIALLMLGLNLLFLCLFRWGVSGLMAGQIIGLTIVFIIGIAAYYKTSCHTQFNLRTTLRACPRYLKMGIVFVPGMVLAWVLSSSDRWFLARYASLHDTGIYALASVIGQLFQMVTVIPLQSAYTPYVLKKLAENKDNPLPVEQWNQRNMIYSMVGLTLLVTVGLYAAQPFLQWFLPPRYQEAIRYMWPIVMGYIFLLGEQFAAIFVIYNKKIYFQSASYVVPSVLSALLNIVLIPRFNIYGCVAATMIVYLVHFGIKLTYNLHLQKKIRAQLTAQETSESFPYDPATSTVLSPYDEHLPPTPHKPIYQSKQEQPPHG